MEKSVRGSLDWFGVIQLAANRGEKEAPELLLPQVHQLHSVRQLRQKGIEQYVQNKMQDEAAMAYGAGQRPGGVAANGAGSQYTSVGGGKISITWIPQFECIDYAGASSVQMLRGR
mmetsp:Transcript_74275/g.210255  ORF Transcript_74275/g.210255 Transcript_74275/m.210255 type:complete len:116 (-) Transcript_74275:384-731(-)